MRMIVRVLLLLTHLFILFYKEGIHMINFNIPRLRKGNRIHDKSHPESQDQW